MKYEYYLLPLSTTRPISPGNAGGFDSWKFQSGIPFPHMSASYQVEGTPNILRLWNNGDCIIVSG
jgi:hypothetical protein